MMMTRRDIFLKIVSFAGNKDNAEKLAHKLGINLQQLVDGVQSAQGDKEIATELARILQTDFYEGLASENNIIR